MDKNKFTEFLLSIGFNETGAAEVIKRFDEDRADMDDYNLYKRYHTAAGHD